MQPMVFTHSHVCVARGRPACASPHVQDGSAAGTDAALKLSPLPQPRARGASGPPSLHSGPWAGGTALGWPLLPAGAGLLRVWGIAGY